MAAPNTAPTAEFQSSGKPIALPRYLVDANGNPISSTNPLNPNQRVNAQSGDFVAGSIADLATVAGAISASKMQANTAQIGGQVPTLDNTTIQAVSMRGKGTVAGDTALLLETQPGIAGVMLTEDVIRTMTLAGKVYSATTGRLTSPGAGTFGFQLFNPSGGTKSLLIFSLIIVVAAAQVHDIRKTAVNVNTITGWSDVAAAISNNGASVTASTATASYTNVNATGGLLGTAREVSGQGASQTIEVFSNGECIWLPAGAGSIAGIAAYVFIGAAVVWGVTCEYLEF